MAALKRLKSAHKNFKFSVFGYLREREADGSINIPMMIKYLCLNYYLVVEQFTKHGPHMVVNNLKNTAKMIFESNNAPSIIHGESANTVYGDDVINLADESISEYKWIFKITGDLSHSFAVGIDSSNKKWINDDFTEPWKNKCTFYAWDIDAEMGDVMLYDNGDDIKRTKINKYAEDKYHTVDMVLTLNMKDESLHFVFDQQEIQSHKNISLDVKQYHMAIYMCIPNQEISLQEFSIKQRD